MSCKEPVSDIIEFDCVGLRLARRKQLRMFETLPIAGTDDSRHGSELQGPSIRKDIEDTGRKIRIARVARRIEMDDYVADHFERLY
jgi:hypothetical protein